MPLSDKQKRAFKLKALNKDKILKECPNCPDTAGIYFLLREEDGFKYAYIGQSKHILTRLAEHLMGFQYIDLSLKKHGFFDYDNPTGYKIHFLRFPEPLLDEMEQKYIKQYANAGYQLRNTTAGGQGEGKTDLGNSRPQKTYMQGVVQGYANAQRDVAHWFKLHLDYMPKKEPPTKLQLRAMQKFKDFMEISNESKID
jgi:hypothetical protein